MTVARLQELQRSWRALHVLDDVENALDRIGFTRKYIEEAARTEAGASKSKVIKDGVWGMVEVEASCLRLLDSPLVQRMRGIRQLGLSYLTYPSAEHTRFSHSLGMFSVVARFLDSTRPSPAGSSPSAVYDRWAPGEQDRRALLHAAILHDIGHMPFSHVTEGIMHADKDRFRCGRLSVDDFIFPAEDALRVSPKLAECLSLAILLTDRFADFYRLCVDASNPKAPFRIAALVAGIEPESGLSGLSSLISGKTIDADKIDYINRDARACGIPVGVDVSRLFMRSSFLKVEPAELQRLRNTDTRPSSPEVIFVVNASGLDSIEEIGQARTALYHRVYLHQTTRNAERVMGLAMERCLGTEASPAKLTDALEIWSMDDLALLGAIATHEKPDVAALGRRLQTRRLPKRACAFGRNHARLSIPVDAVFPRITPEAKKRLAKQIVGNGLEALRANSLQGQGQRALEARILKETASLARLLRADTSGPWKDLPDSGPEFITVLPMSNLEPNRSDCIILENERLSSTAASSVSDEQMEAADIVKSTGYVMAPDPAWRELACLASRTVMYQERPGLADVTLLPYPGAPETVVKAQGHILLDLESVARRVGLDRERLEEAQRAAVRAGYYDRFPKLVPHGLRHEDLQRVAKVFQDFNGQGDWSVTVRSLEAFLGQFPPRLQQPMLDLLGKATSFDRARLISSIRERLQRIPLEGARGFITGLTPDSGNSVRMKLEHELKKALSESGWTFCKTIRDVFASARAGDRLVLCDDNVTSGSQALCQFKAWLDVPETEWTADERQEHGIERKRLDERDIELLKTLKLHIVTAAGTNEGQAFLQEGLPRIGLPHFQGFSFGFSLSANSVDLGALKDFLTDVGKHVLAWARHGETDLSALGHKEAGDCAADALGYRGAKGLAFTPMNVPVGTLTALWCPGFHKGEPWMPLLIRRGYLEHLVLS